jgi:hypothetical protein
MMPEEQFEVTALPRPVDMLFAALAVVLIVLGAVLIAVSSTERPAHVRVPVVAPAQLVAQHLDGARGV